MKDQDLCLVSDWKWDEMGKNGPRKNILAGVDFDGSRWGVA